MARRRRRRNRKHRITYANYATIKHVEKIVEGETNQSHQKEYQAAVKQVESDILARTVFVTNIRDVNDDRNLQRLRHHLEVHYGPVEECSRGHYHNPRSNFRKPKYYPPARVKFRHRRDAEALFGGKALAEYTGDPILVPCPEVGMYTRHGGSRSIRVQPTKRYPGMADATLQGGCIELQVVSLGIGHWVPASLDAYLDYCELIEKGHGLHETGSHDSFVEEELLENCDLTMELDLNNRRVQILAPQQTENCENSYTSKGSARSPIDQVSTELADFDLRLAIDHILNSDMDLLHVGSWQDVISFRFKELNGYIHFYSNKKGSSFLIFALKWPPGLFEENKVDMRKRKIGFSRITADVFGRCQAIKVELGKDSTQVLLRHQAIVRLKKSGVFSTELGNSDRVAEIEVTKLKCFEKLHKQFRLDLSCVHSRSPEAGTTFSMSYHILIAITTTLTHLMLRFSFEGVER